MDRNEKAREDLKAKGNAIKEPEVTCEQCGKKIEGELFKKQLGGQEKNFCNRDCIKLYKINMEEQRKITEERTNSDINFLDREIKYKQEQLKNGITETRAINQVPGQPAVILDGYSDGLKPAYIIENEIERDNQQIKEKKRQIENVKLAREEDAKSD